ncbi:MAG TPA: efflux RND transporter periplasmic adaptor subunit [Bryobacterales bacterium]|nr:efflux RND transporter periplasmic adaptor subunit [Bryobacterales bacterium]
MKKPCSAGRCLAAAAVTAALVAAAACSRLKQDLQRRDTAAAAAYDAERPQASLFTLPQNQLEHLKITPVQKTTWSLTVHTTGTVDWDADHTTQAITQVSGPIVRILAEPGTVVKTGDPLLYVSSSDVSNAISAYKKARNRLELAKRTLERDQDLLEHHAIPRKDYESAQADYNDAFTEVQSDLAGLKIFGITEKQIQEAERQGAAISPELALRSPISGTVVQRLVLPGQLVQAGATTCFLISDMSTVWVEGHIYDRDLAAVHVGDTVEEATPSSPEAFHGVLAYIGAMIDPATRTTPVRIVTRNPAGRLRKDMFVDAVIHTRTRRGGLAVPTSAVLHNAQNEPFVYVEAAPGQFAQRLVTVGTQQPAETEILSGLKEGEKVVSEGSVFLQFANSYQ